MKEDTSLLCLEIPFGRENLRENPKFSFKFVKCELNDKYIQLMNQDMQ